MTLSPRAIAVQGIGYTPILTATQGLTGFEIFLPRAGGGGGGAHGVDNYKRNRPITIDGHEDDLRAEIITQDDEILAVIMSAVACGALQ
jgi:hypothetical protein